MTKKLSKFRTVIRLPRSGGIPQTLTHFDGATIHYPHEDLNLPETDFRMLGIQNPRPIRKDELFVMDYYIYEDDDNLQSTRIRIHSICPYEES